METFGIILALLVLTTTVAAFIYDGYLWVRGEPTVSRRVWDQLAAWREGKGRFPWWTIGIVVWWILGAIGLAIHFYV